MNNKIFPDTILQSRVAVHLIQTIQHINDTSQQNIHQFVLSSVRSLPTLKRMLKECLLLAGYLAGYDQELRARCISLLD